VHGVAVPMLVSNGSVDTSSSDKRSHDSGLLMFSRLPGLSSDVINDVFQHPPAAAAVSVSTDIIAYTLASN